MRPDLKQQIFSIDTDADFLETAMEIYNFQADNNTVYKEFLNQLHLKDKKVSDPSDFTFLPISFFRNHRVLTGNHLPKIVFESSGTTGESTSRHFVTDPEIYNISFDLSFRLFYGDPSEYVFFALLPSYSERKNSSLVYMVQNLISKSQSSSGGFYLDNTDEMLENINKSRTDGKKVILIGVSFALLDLSGKHSTDLPDIIVMETGGMKGRRKEITRAELHEALKRAFSLDKVHSEYGMTELLSQAWSGGDGLFRCPPWMKILIRDPLDPLTVTDEPGRTGGLNIIDLANIYSCSFIATGDLGRLNKDGSFEVLGRIDNSDIRGCNLLIQ